MMGYTALKIVELVQQSVRAGPWLSDDVCDRSSHPEELQKYLGEMDTEFQQLNCVPMEELRTIRCKAWLISRRKSERMPATTVGIQPIGGLPTRWLASRCDQ